MPLRIFTSGGADAATALIRAILERHKYQYEVHDVAAAVEAKVHSPPRPLPIALFASEAHPPSSPQAVPP